MKRLITVVSVPKLADEEARIVKLAEINRKMASLVETEKRWLRKFKLATGKLQKLRASMKRLEAKKEKLQ